MLGFSGASEWNRRGQHATGDASPDVRGKIDSLYIKTDYEVYGQGHQDSLAQRLAEECRDGLPILDRKNKQDTKQPKDCARRTGGQHQRVIPIAGRNGRHSRGAVEHEYMRPYIVRV